MSTPAETSVSHTPGPWRLDDSEESTEVFTTDGICIAQAIDPTRHERSILSWAEVQANRRLIAAAPELLEALVEVTDALAMQMTFHRVPEGNRWTPEDEATAQTVERGRAAIEQAEGRSQP